MVLSSRDYNFFMRDYGSAMGIIQQQIPVQQSRISPYREIGIETKRAGATTGERLEAISGPKV